VALETGVPAVQNSINLEGNSISQAAYPSTLPICCKHGLALATPAVYIQHHRYAGTCDPDDVISTRTEWKNTGFYGPERRSIAANQSLLSPSFILTDGNQHGTCPKSDVLRSKRRRVCQPTLKVAGISGNVIDTAFCAAELSASGRRLPSRNKGGMAAVTLRSRQVWFGHELWDDYAAICCGWNSTDPVN